jgi:GTP1/Obg family GTP-binding protein
MTKIEDLTEKLDELYEAFDQLDQIDIDQKEIQDIVNNIEKYSSEVAERVRSLETLNEKYEEVIPQMQRELESYRDTESDDIDREYFADLVLEIAEEYERSSSRLEDMREEHNDNILDEDPFDILYN